MIIGPQGVEQTSNTIMQQVMAEMKVLVILNN